MTIAYFRHQICEELDGACNYIKKALEIKMVYPSWAKQYVEMSAQELAHATAQFKMAEEYFQSILTNYSEEQRAAMPWLDESKAEIVELYTEKYAKVKAMHDLFNK